MREISVWVAAACAALIAFGFGWSVSIYLGPQPSELGLWSAAGTVVTAVATVVLVIVTALLWKVTDRSARSAKIAADAASESARLAGEASSQAAEIAKKQLRAYVLVEGSGLTCDAGGQHLDYVLPNSRPIGSIGFKNTGQTPALDLQAHVRIGIRPQPAAPESFALVEMPPASVMSLGAGHSSRSMAVAPAPISSQSVQNLASGTEAIYVYGEIRYRDIFGDSHVSEFRLRNKSGFFDGSMTFTDQGNNAT